MAPIGNPHHHHPDATTTHRRTCTTRRIRRSFRRSDRAVARRSIRLSLRG